jgi:hypothetical protein
MRIKDRQPLWPLLWRRKINQAEQPTGGTGAERCESRESSRGNRKALEVRHCLMGQWPTSAAVVVIEETRLELRDINLDRTMAGAGRTRQALVEVRS